MIEFIPATEEHAVLIAAAVRKRDAEELEALGFASPLHGITASLRASVNALYVSSNGVPLAIFGYAAPQVIGQTCEIWMITAEGVERHTVAFARASRRVMKAFADEFSHLEGWVDARHEVCIKWLRWLNFTVHEPIALQPRGLPFHRFEMRTR